jgi:HAE1 family hydrophobic/amphiphilic exporter-1
MAAAVIVGLTFATVLTLVLVPVLYSVADDLGDFFGRHFVARGRELEAAVAGGRAGMGVTGGPSRKGAEAHLVGVNGRTGPASEV